MKKKLDLNGCVYKKIIQIRNDLLRITIKRANLLEREIGL